MLIRLLKRFETDCKYHHLHTSVKTREKCQLTVKKDMLQTCSQLMIFTVSKRYNKRIYNLKLFYVCVLIRFKTVNIMSCEQVYNMSFLLLVDVFYFFWFLQRCCSWWYLHWVLNGMVFIRYDFLKNFKYEKKS